MKRETGLSCSLDMLQPSRLEHGGINLQHVIVALHEYTMMEGGKLISKQALQSHAPHAHLPHSALQGSCKAFSNPCILGETPDFLPLEENISRS